MVRSAMVGLCAMALAGCPSSGSSSVDASNSGGDGGGSGGHPEAGGGAFCTKPTAGLYGMSRGVSQSQIVLFGQGDWDAILGAPEVGTTKVVLDSFSAAGNVLRATAGGFMYTIDPQAAADQVVPIVADGNFVMPSSATHYDVLRMLDDHDYIAISGQDVYCGTIGAAKLVGSLVVPCGVATGVKGSCSPPTTPGSGTFDLTVLFTCGPNLARLANESLVGGNVTESDGGDIAVGLSGLSVDGHSAGRTALYTVGSSGATAGRPTKACIDETIDNPFNGSTITADLLE